MQNKLFLGVYIYHLVLPSGLGWGMWRRTKGGRAFKLYLRKKGEEKEERVTSLLTVTQVIIGSDREMCRQLQRLSHELCLVLPGSSTKWTINDDGGCAHIFFFFSTLERLCRVPA